MHHKVFGKENIFAWLLLFFGLLAIWSCHPQKPSVTVSKPIIMEINKVVVVGFFAAVSQGSQAEAVRSPLSGSIFIAEPVPQDVIQKMTDMLFNKTEAEKGFEIISPAQAKGVISRIMRSDQTLSMSPVKILQDVGSAFNADAVLAGYIYRWREREGTDYAANRPASVAFDLHLISAVDGTNLWNAKFDKTQRSLSENVFDLATFFKSKGRWLTAEKLAVLGFKKIMAEMPAGKIPETQTKQIEPEGY